MRPTAPQPARRARTAVPRRGGAGRRLAVLCLLLALAPGCGGCSHERTAALTSLRSDDPSERADGLRRLGRVAREEDFLLFAKAAKDPAAAVRLAAIESLGARRDPRAVDVASELLGDADPAVQEAAAAALAQLPSPKARPYLIRSYARRGPVARAAIVAALAEGGAGPAEAIRAEARLLWERNEAALLGGSMAERAGAAEELGRSGRPEALQLLRPLLEDDAVAVSAAAARGLGATGDPAARSLLEPLLSVQHPELREAAAEALGRLGDPTAIAPLARAAREATAGAVAAAAALTRLPGSGPAACEAALSARSAGPAAVLARHAASERASCDLSGLGKRVERGGPEAAAALAAAGPLGAGELVPRAAALAAEAAAPLELRVEAIRYLGERASAPEATALNALLTDLLPAVVAPAAAEGAPAGTTELAIALAGAVGNLRAGGAGDLLVRLLEAPEPEVRLAAVAGLGRLASSEALARLAAVARTDPALPVRIQAVETIGATGGPGGTEALVGIALEAEPATRGAALETLGAMPGARVPTAALEAFARSGIPEAAVALGWLGYDEAGPLLRTALATSAVAGRAEVVEALGRLGDAGASRQLGRELFHDRPEIRAAACRALGRIGPAAEAREALTALAEGDYYLEVRQAAAAALAPR